MITSLARVIQVLVEEDNTDQIPGIIEELTILEQSDTAIMHQVETLRQHLEDLVTLSNNFSDPEVLATSQALDEALNKLYRVLSSITRTT
ncbi:MAG: aspartyl-phosphate phosphatase Spo0E family protein [Syntrophomonadaceae bacterium]|jgi:hypothetical protein|nr:aspartyl-phosphate phosphatase Spo0E family protein [Syntrophomonadaceae bacterium]MDD3271512.1 aspartyl-phosphate phosphatase Spo0E family protein [Syntrophomonadaceae bacterium]MDD3899360.1 aspartyl-phosphate phosphatase Spo0E family protein [Syntrophomonadaceae bacterium]